MATYTVQVPVMIGSISDLNLLKDTLTKEECNWQEISDEELQLQKQAADNAKVVEVVEVGDVGDVANVMNAVELAEGRGKQKGSESSGDGGACRKKQKTQVKSVMVFGDEADTSK